MISGTIIQTWIVLESGRGPIVLLLNMWIYTYVLLRGFELDITIRSESDRSSVDPNDVDLRFWLFEILISSRDKLSKFRYENQMWNRGNRRNRKSFPTNGTIVLLLNLKWMRLRKLLWTKLRSWFSRRDTMDRMLRSLYFLDRKCWSWNNVVNQCRSWINVWYIRYVGPIEVPAWLSL